MFRAIRSLFRTIINFVIAVITFPLRLLRSLL